MPIMLVKRFTRNNSLLGQISNVVDDDHEFSANELPSGGIYFHIGVTDKTLAECADYMQEWRHDPTTTQISRQGNVRLIEVVSSMVSVTGKNAFERAAVEQLLVDINGTYDSHTQNSFRFFITATVEERDAIIDKINDAVRLMQYQDRRWFATQAAMQFLEANGGAVSGTASQVNGYIRDGLLD